MGLPIVPLATGSVTIGDEKVAYRALSRAEAMTFAQYQQPGAGLDPGKVSEFEVFVLMCATGCTEAEANEFRQGNDTETVQVLMTAILDLSKLTEADAAADPKASTSEPS